MLRARLVTQEYLVPLGQPVLPDPMVPQVRQVSQVSQARRVPMEQQEQQEQRGPLVGRGPLVRQELPAQPAPQVQE